MIALTRCPSSAAASLRFAEARARPGCSALRASASALASASASAPAASSARRASVCPASGAQFFGPNAIFARRIVDRAQARFDARELSRIEVEPLAIRSQCARGLVGANSRLVAQRHDFVECRVVRGRVPEALNHGGEARLQRRVALAELGFGGARRIEQRCRVREPRLRLRQPLPFAVAQAQAPQARPDARSACRARPGAPRRPARRDRAARARPAMSARSMRLRAPAP